MHEEQRADLGHVVGVAVEQVLGVVHRPHLQQACRRRTPRHTHASHICHITTTIISINNDNNNRVGKEAGFGGTVDTADLVHGLVALQQALEHLHRTMTTMSACTHKRCGHKM